MPLQLPASLNMLKLWSFSNKNSTRRKIISIKPVIATEADKLQANYRAAKEFQIKKKYEVELAALNA